MFGVFSGTRESSESLRRELHLKAEKLFETKQTASPQTLFTQTESLKNRVQQFAPWDGCSRFFCPINPYFSYHEILERIREANVIARARRGSLSAQRSRDIITGVGRGEEQAERLRGSGSTAEQIAATAVFGIPGLLVTSTTARETARNVPGAVSERAKELAEGNVCTSEQVGIPLIGKLVCPGGIGCGWACTYEKHRIKFWIISGLVGLSIALVVIRPYIGLASKIIK